MEIGMTVHHQATPKGFQGWRVGHSQDRQCPWCISSPGSFFLNVGCWNVISTSSVQLLLAWTPAALCTWCPTGCQELILGQGGAEQPQRGGANPGTEVSQGFGTAHATAQTLLWLKTAFGLRAVSTTLSELHCHYWRQQLSTYHLQQLYHPLLVHRALGQREILKLPAVPTHLECLRREAGKSKKIMGFSGKNMIPSCSCSMTTGWCQRAQGSGAKPEQILRNEAGGPSPPGAEHQLNTQGHPNPHNKR